MNTRLHIIIIRIAIVLVVTAGGLMLLSAVKTRESKPCSKVQVQYKNGVSSGFVPEKEVLETIREMLQAAPVGAELGRFDLNGIEKQLEKHPWIYDAQLYFDNNQSLHVVLDEAIPVARVMDMTGKSFYLDHTGRELPVKMDYRADLPVFTNVPLKRNAGTGLKTVQQICLLAKAIASDSFWMAQAAQIDVLPNGKMEMIPAIGNHIVELGDAHEPGEMLFKLKHFYMALAKAGRLDDYARIQAGFEGQIVAQKAQYVVAKSDGNQAMSTYQQIVNENKQLVDANAVVKETGAARLVTDAPGERSGRKKTEAKPGDAEKKEKEALPKEEIPLKPKEIKTEKKEEKVPKALMPKIEKN